MPSTAITRLELTRRREQLDELIRYLDLLEADHAAELARLDAFARRYDDVLGQLYEELDQLEAQLHAATEVLAQALQRQGAQSSVKAPAPTPRVTALPAPPTLPERAALPPEPSAPAVDLAPPTLKTLYRRAAMRLHPDLAPTDAERAAREQQMMVVNDAYERSDRRQLEVLLLAAGEPSERVIGGQADAMRHWLAQCEQAVQARIRIVQAQAALLKTQPLHRLSVAIAAGEARGLDAFAVMASRLRAQIAERRQELYIGQRLQPESELANEFVRQRWVRSAER